MPNLETGQKKLQGLRLIQNKTYSVLSVLTKNNFYKILFIKNSNLSKNFKILFLFTEIMSKSYLIKLFSFLIKFFVNYKNIHDFNYFCDILVSS